MIRVLTYSMTISSQHHGEMRVVLGKLANDGDPQHLQLASRLGQRCVPHCTTIERSGHHSIRICRSPEEFGHVLNKSELNNWPKLGLNQPTNRQKSIKRIGISATWSNGMECLIFAAEHHLGWVFFLWIICWFIVQLFSWLNQYFYHFYLQFVSWTVPYLHNIHCMVLRGVNFQDVSSRGLVILAAHVVPVTDVRSGHVHILFSPHPPPKPLHWTLPIPQSYEAKHLSGESQMVDVHHLYLYNWFHPFSSWFLVENPIASLPQNAE